MGISRIFSRLLVSASPLRVAPRHAISIRNINTSGDIPQTITIKLQAERLKNIHQETQLKFHQILTSSAHLPIETEASILENIEKGNIDKATKQAEDAFLQSNEVSQADKELGLQKKLIAEYERQGWDELTSQIETLGQDHQNILVPQNALALDINGNQFHVFEKSIKAHQGISSSSLNTSQHAANLWHSRLLAENGEELFSGIRHASLSYHPDDKLNKEENKDIAKGKVKELVIAALIAKNKAEIEKRLAHPEENLSPLKLKLTSTSLLSMIDLHLGPIQQSEESQFNQQRQAIEELQTELKEITIGESIIPVEIEALCFNTGVNNFSLGSSTILNLIKANGWQKADAINAKSLQSLLGDLAQEADLGGWVKEYLDKLDDSAQSKLKKAKIEVLAKEIKHIFTNKLHHNENDERYALPKRLILLTYLIDALPSFNCKSGKDRTAMVDAEVKALAATLAKQDLSAPIHTQTQIETLQAFHLDSGNFKIQRLNTGLSGNKVMEYESDYFNRIFTPEQLLLMRGLI